MNFIFPRMADPTSTETPFRGGILIEVRLWEVGRKARHRAWELLVTGMVRSMVGFVWVVVWNT